MPLDKIAAEYAMDRLRAAQAAKRFSDHAYVSVDGTWGAEYTIALMELREALAKLPPDPF